MSKSLFREKNKPIDLNRNIEFIYLPCIMSRGEEKQDGNEHPPNGTHGASMREMDK